MADGQNTRAPSDFEVRRAEIVGQIGESLEQVLTQINALNRSMESIIEIGNEFASVEALWSQFENVMGASQNQNQDQDQSQDQATAAAATATAIDAGRDSEHNNAGTSSDM